MIALTKIRTLDLADAGDPALPRHLSAASGLVCTGSSLYVVADDELHLGIFSAGDRAPGRLLRLFDGDLPTAKAERKRRKPDFEAITQLPAFGIYSNGALLALGSGSKRNRRRGALLGLDALGAIGGPPRIVDFSDLFAGLDRHVPALNIEGAVVSGDAFCLLQRANKRHPQNAIVRFPLARLLAALDSGAPVGAIVPSSIDVVDLGQIRDVPLAFTDGAALPDGGMVFTAVAEDTEDTYNDGACVGAAVGLLANDGTLRRLDPIEQAHKVEGVAAHIDGDVIRLLLVTDADDPEVPSALFSSTIPNAAG
jgi:hypothetical protein